MLQKGVYTNRCKLYGKVCTFALHSSKNMHLQTLCHKPHPLVPYKKSGGLVSCRPWWTTVSETAQLIQLFIETNFMYLNQ